MIEEIEKDLFLLGIIAIEDALQEKVEETLDCLIKVGIKIWMITGDQKLTAESIAKSTSLITDEFHIIDIKENDNLVVNSIENTLIQGIEFMKSNYEDTKFSLIVDLVIGIAKNGLIE